MISTGYVAIQWQLCPEIVSPNHAAWKRVQCSFWDRLAGSPHERHDVLAGITRPLAIVFNYVRWPSPRGGPAWLRLPSREHGA